MVNVGFNCKNQFHLEFILFVIVSLALAFRLCFQLLAEELSQRNVLSFFFFIDELRLARTLLPLADLSDQNSTLFHNLIRIIHGALGVLDCVIILTSP